MGILNKVLSPFKHLVAASGESFKKVGKGAGKVVKTSVNMVRGVGASFVKHGKMAVRNISRRKGGAKKRVTRKARA